MLLNFLIPPKSEHHNWEQKNFIIRSFYAAD